MSARSRGLSGRLWASGPGTRAVTDAYDVRPIPPPSRAGTRAATHGQVQEYPLAAVHTTVTATVSGPNSSRHAHCRPRTSARWLPVVRVSHRLVPSWLYRL